MEENNKQSPEINNTIHNKHSVGVILGMFFNLLGLVIGICLYNNNEKEKNTFISGWIKGFVVSIIFAVIIGIIVYFSTLNAIDNAVNEYNNAYNEYSSAYDDAMKEYETYFNQYY